MPNAPKRPCLFPRCGALVRSGYCQLHGGRGGTSGQDGTSTQRGYGARWQRYRAWWLLEHPACGDRESGQPQTGDSSCRTAGRYTIGSKRAPNVVDHVIPMTGADDPTHYDPRAHQTLCKRCHQVKRQRESMEARDGSMRSRWDR